MTKERILSVFEDINLMYNNPNMYDVLSKMLDKLVEDSKKSVEYETDEDCISRERVLLEINRIGFDAFTSYDYYSYLYDFIDGLPSEEPERKPGKWIPCSERLPEPDTFVLTYHRHLSFDYQYVSSIDETTGEWSGFCGNLSDEVLAWMPLPDAYEGETT